MSRIKRMRSRLGELLKSSYVKNILILAGGTGAAQFLGIITSPIVRRLFSPEDFGLLAVVNSVTTILLPLVSIGYIQAIMLPKSNKTALQMIWICIRLSLIVVGIALMLLVFFRERFADFLGISEYSYYLFFIPVFLLGKNLYQILYNYNSREKKYKDISKTQVSIALSAPLVNIVTGLLKQTSYGLFLGGLVSSWVGIGRLMKNVNIAGLRKAIGKDSRLRETMKRYRRFPMFGMPATIANVASVQVIDIFLSAAFSIGLLGQYALGKMLLNLPLIFMGKSFSQVYYQQSVENKKNDRSNLGLFRKTVGMLSAIAIPIFVLLYFVIEWLIEFVYGAQWIEAAFMMKVLMPFFAIRFVSSSVSNTLFTYEKQNYNLYINLLLLFTISALIFISKSNDYEFLEFLSLYSVVFSVLYFLFILLYYFIIVSHDRKVSSQNI